MTASVEMGLAGAADGDWRETSSGLLVPRHSVDHRPIAVDLFAGAGGFSCGFHQAGWHVAAALEMDPHAALTYAINLARPGVRFHFDSPEREAAFNRVLEKHLGLKRKKSGVIEPGLLAGDGWISAAPETERGCEHIWVADARNVRGRDILNALGVEEVDCVMGGPPSQGFSYVGRRDVMDPRNSLVFEFVRLVLEIQPKTMVMENVPGLATMVTPEGLPVLDVISEQLERGGMGTYDAIRRALAGRDSARAVVRGRGKEARAIREEAAKQGSLFAEEEVIV